MDPDRMIVEDPWWAFCPHQPHYTDKPACIACPRKDECPIDRPLSEEERAMVAEWAWKGLPKID